MARTVKLRYYKPGGKWYSDGEYETRQDSFYSVVEEVRFMLKAGECPGLIEHSVERNNFITVIEYDELTHLILPVKLGIMVGVIENFCIVVGHDRTHARCSRCGENST